MSYSEIVNYLPKSEVSNFDETWLELGDSDHFWMIWRFKIIKNYLETAGFAFDRHLKVLDVGSGAGALKKQLTGATVWTIDCADIDKEALSRLETGRGQKFLYNIIDRKPDMVGQYDAVFLLDVIEHLAEPQEILAAALDHAKAGGLLLVNVPALNSLKSGYDRVIGHIRRYNKRTLNEEFSQLDQNIEKRWIGYWGFTLLPALIVRKVISTFISNTKTVVRVGFSPRAKLVNNVFLALMKIELFLIKNPLLGSSVICCVRKKNEN